MAGMKSALIEEANKVLTAFISWGLGICFMISYCLFIYWLKIKFNIYFSIGGGLLFLGVFFFFIDLWWGYNQKKLLRG